MQHRDEYDSPRDDHDALTRRQDRDEHHEPEVFRLPYAKPTIQRLAPRVLAADAAERAAGAPKCYACDAAATGLAFRGGPKATAERVPACARHADGGQP